MSTTYTKYLRKCLKQSPCGERLLGVIIKELQKMKEAGYDVDKCLNIGKKLLMCNYYKKADDMRKYIEDSDDKMWDFLDYKIASYKLAEEQSNASNKKKIDYQKFFMLIMNNLEDWC